MINAEQFAEWKEHPVTREVFAGLKGVLDSIKDDLANGNTVGSNAEDTHGLTNRAVGQIAGLEQILEVSYDNSNEQVDTDGKSRY